jgi:hypothetical protein
VIYFGLGWLKMIMDNEKQVWEIARYQQYLTELIGKEIDKDIAAGIWIRKYAKVWRLRHPVPPDLEPR